MKKKRTLKPTKKTQGAWWKLPRYRALTVIGVVVLGVIASVALFVTVRGWERTRLQAAFDQMAADRVYVVLNGINNNVGALQSIRAFYAVNEGIQEPGFRTFVKEDLSRHSEMLALAWVPRVVDQERDIYEETVRRAGRSTFHIVELDAQGRLRKATRHEDYLPIQTIEPLEAHVAMMGLDLASHPVLRPALERARDTGEPMTTARVRLGDAPKATFGCWMVVPLYRKGAPLETLTDRRQNLVAFFAVLVDLKQIVEQALKTLAPGDIDVLLADDTAPAAERMLHLYRSHPQTDGAVFPAAEPTTDSSARARTELVWRTAFFMMGRQWSIVCRAAPQFTVTNRQWESVIILFSGFLSTALLGLYLFTMLSRATRIEQLAAELRVANKRLEELSALKDQFVSNVSHDLRTPLTAIKEGVSLLLDKALGPITDEQGDFLHTVDENIDRLTELITNLLDLSKIEAGRLRLYRRRLDLQPLIASTLKSYKTITGQRTLKVEAPGTYEVFADPNRILQVVNNLLSNAVKFTKDDGTITFLLQPQNGHLVVSVKDDGMGIAPEDLSKLFQKFSQVGAGVGRPKGTGLGLALCKELVELHHGRISVTSEVGKGSAFTFTLPIYTPDVALQESFTELVDFAKRGGQETVGVVVMDAEPLVGSAAAQEAVPAPNRLEQVTELIHKHVRQGDVVLPLAPRWIAILAITDEPGLQALVQQLQRALDGRLTTLDGTPVTVPLRVGTAIYPTDDTDIRALLQKAAASLGRGLPEAATVG